MKISCTLIRVLLVYMYVCLTGLISAYRDCAYISECVKSDLASLVDYCNKSRLVINCAKSSVRSPLRDISLDSVILDVASLYSFIGVDVDNDLIFHTHCKRLMSKLNSAFGLLTRSYFLKPHALTPLYNCIVRTHLRIARRYISLFM